MLPSAISPLYGHFLLLAFLTSFIPFSQILLNIQKKNLHNVTNKLFLSPHEHLRDSISTFPEVPTQKTLHIKSNSAHWVKSYSTYITLESYFNHYNSQIFFTCFLFDIIVPSNQTQDFDATMILDNLTVRIIYIK